MGLGPDGSPRDLTADEIAEIVRFVRARRSGEGRYDVVASATGIDAPTIEAFERAGATWLLPGPATQGPGWEDEVLAIVRSGRA
jgi:hypothetical protein